MSSSSASRSDGRESEPSLLVVDESPFFKMVEDGASCKLQDVLRIPKTLTRDGRVVIPGGLRIKSAIASVKILYIAMLIMILIAVDLVCLGIFLFHCRITRVDR